LSIDTGLSPNDPTVEAAFRSELLHQGLIVVGVLVVLWLLWGTALNWIPAAAGGRTASPEPRGRRVLRIGFGVAWLFDGLLQAQPQMAAGLPSQVIAPAAQGSPAWVLRLVNWGGTAWAYHPVQAGTAVIWIQVGLGLWLLVAPRGTWSRLAGVVSAAWGLAVWGFAEAFGSMFAPGASWLTGLPGAALLYALAGVLIALPFSAWRGRLPGRVLLGALGLFFLGMAALQAWPGNGFWRGGSGGPLATIAATAAKTPQPHVIARLVAAFGTFTAGNAFAVNLVVVILLTVGGLAFGSLALAGGAPGWPTARLGRAAVIAGAVFCLAVWVLFQDFGFFGGLGTDPNSMIPTILLLWAGYAAVAAPDLVAAPAVASVPEPGAPVAAESVAAGSDPGTGEPAAPVSAREVPAAAAADQGPVPAWQRAVAAVGPGSVAACCALGVVAFGAVPMAAASVNRTADPIIAEAIAGYSPPLRMPAPNFSLANQDGKPVSLASLRGKVVLLTFLDPVCTTDCTFMGQEFLRAGQLLAADRSRVELVGVVVNPDYYSQAVVRAYDQQEGLSALPNWDYLTGTPAQLEKVWQPYGVVGESLPAGAMIGHNDLAYVIDQSGQIRQELDFDPGSGTSASVSSFATLLVGDAHQLLGAS
jgi:cytochrome oxidase Cu insertion factor (SCO1/SenC/PrrC family)